ncbi:MAG TPA: cytochrome c [Sphingomicrobium sp.]|nr:cytochrome c [Sphingomicrobium sp.]
MTRPPLIAILMLAGCHQSLTMSDQPKGAEWERTTLFRNGRVLQAPPPGSVAREDDTGDVLKEKPPMTLALVQRGRERFNIFCSECHGYTGEGDGMVVQRGFPHPPNFHDPRLVAAPDQHFVDVITNGHGVMYSYADRVPPADRWAIAAYIRALQKLPVSGG